MNNYGENENTATLTSDLLVQPERERERSLPDSHQLRNGIPVNNNSPPYFRLFKQRDIHGALKKKGRVTGSKHYKDAHLPGYRSFRLLHAAWCLINPTRFSRIWSKFYSGGGRKTCDNALTNACDRNPQATSVSLVVSVWQRRQVNTTRHGVFFSRQVRVALAQLCVGG